MKYILTLIIFTLFIGAHAQQWVDKKYNYDSTLNVVYGSAINFNGGIDTLRMDIYRPVCDDISQSAKRPLLVWIHGGAFLAGDKNDASITRLCKQFAKRGYVTVSLSYRLGFVSDDAAWSCNFPNYSCVFAADSAEWIRAWYRGVQDAKGALRYLANRNSQLNIDINNVFVAGESAGALIALGVGLMDTVVERMPQTFAISAVQNPNSNTANCAHNVGKTFTTASVPRPDLGGIDGIIEPTTLSYTIKGIGNMYGAMFSNLLKNHKAGVSKPSIYSFHQPCDMVVPIDSGKVFAGLSWCMTNGYNCFGIANTAKLYGSRTISDLNTANTYGYAIHNEFTTINFPYNFLFGAGSCADQVNNPCHGYDNSVLRETNLATYFAPLITTTSVCQSTLNVNGINSLAEEKNWAVYPNPFNDNLYIDVNHFDGGMVSITDLVGRVVKTVVLKEQKTELESLGVSKGIYYIRYSDAAGSVTTKKLIKQ